MRAIDADALFERACNLEAQALAYVGKIVNDESKIEEWKIWSAILAERTAFKHDVFDAPTIEAERKKGEWTVKEGELAFWDVCSVCRKVIIHMVPHYNFCPNCGARMEESEE